MREGEGEKGEKREEVGVEVREKEIGGIEKKTHRPSTPLHPFRQFSTHIARKNTSQRRHRECEKERTGTRKGVESFVEIAI